MKVITAQSLANEAAERFKAMYCIRGEWRDKENWIFLPHGRKQAEPLYRELLALGPTPRPKDVAALINDSWIMVPNCDECGASGQVVVQLGELPDYESSTAEVCPDCLAQAMAEVTKSASGGDK